MPIEYNPRGLRSILESSQAHRRLRNREGFTTAHDAQGNRHLYYGGRILDVHAKAQEHAARFPNHRIIVTEDRCNSPLDI